MHNLCNVPDLLANDALVTASCVEGGMVAGMWTVVIDFQTSKGNLTFKRRRLPNHSSNKQPRNRSLTMGVSQFIAMSLRVCEFAFSAVVAGITGSYLNQANIKQASSSSKRDFIYTEGSSLPPLKQILLTSPQSSPALELSSLSSSSFPFAGLLSSTSSCSFYGW